jgi:CRISPR-associated endoribonuclease Cas6
MTTTKESDDRAVACVTLITRPTKETGEELSSWGARIHPQFSWIPLQQLSGTIEFLALLPDPREYPIALSNMIEAIARNPIVTYAEKNLSIVGIETNRRSLHRFSLSIASDSPLPGSIARALHAVVFQWFERGDPHLSRDLHQSEIVPFTLAYRPYSDRQGQLTITLLQKSPLAPLLWGMARDLGQAIALASVNCRIGHSLTWESSEDYGNLRQNTPLSTVNLRFLSPTSFKQDRSIQPFPLPELVFTSLWRKWNRFAPESLVLPPADWPGFVTAFDLKTAAIPFQNHAEIGCIGRAAYRFPDAEIAGNATILAYFATYAGVGRKTAFGMGKTRLIPPKSHE